jgi:2,5-diketo-D-gluconate reductase A
MRGDVPYLQLSGGARIPQLGVGVADIPAAETPAVVQAALESGYRHVDTAQMYGNERGVAEGIARSGIDPAEVFVTSKLTTAMHRYDDAMRAFDISSDRLGHGVIDLYLIHWPLSRTADFVGTWRALCELRDDGRVRAVGVSNFSAEHVRRLVDETGRAPEVNQIELHPYLAQRELDLIHRELGIVTEAWAPLAKGGIVGDPLIEDLASRLGRTAAQVVLRWHVQRGHVVFPKSVRRERLASNLEVFDFELTQDDMNRIGSLDQGRRLGPAPDDVQNEVADPSVDP